MSYAIFQDWEVNKHNIKGRLILIGYRIAHLATLNIVVFILSIPYLILYRIFIEWILGCELPYKTMVGRNTKLFHAQSLVINDGTIIGSQCTLRHCTTIGNKMLLDGSFSRSPILGDMVDVGSNVCIIGPITIGDNVKIGAGSVVVSDVPSDSVVVGNPARIIRK